MNRYENKGKICGQINADVVENMISHFPNIPKNAIVFKLIWNVLLFLREPLMISIYAVHEIKEELILRKEEDTYEKNKLSD